MKERAELLTKSLNEMENVSCNRIEGAMYAFPKIQFTPKAIEVAEKKNVAADLLYCMEMVDETGILTVPGSGFGQKDGTHHFRMTNLVTPTEDMATCIQNLKKFNTAFHQKYS